MCIFYCMLRWVLSGLCSQANTQNSPSQLHKVIRSWDTWTQVDWLMQSRGKKHKSVTLYLHTLPCMQDRHHGHWSTYQKCPQCDKNNRKRPHNYTTEPLSPGRDYLLGTMTTSSRRQKTSYSPLYSPFFFLSVAPHFFPPS